ncbi:hypothetical protein BST61_g3586 [Cercospora zeina]
MQLTRASHKPSTSSRQPAETFTGSVHMDPIFTAGDCDVTIGEGLICSKGEKPRRLQVGDVVHIPAGETHWHGGTKTTMMAHQAISLGKTPWHEELDQKEYEEADAVAT